MTWWMWLALVLASLLVLGLLGWRLFQQVRSLLRELRAASRRVAETQAQAQAEFDGWRTARLADDEQYLSSLQQDVR